MPSREKDAYHDQTDNDAHVGCGVAAPIEDGLDPDPDPDPDPESGLGVDGEGLCPPPRHVWNDGGEEGGGRAHQDGGGRVESGIEFDCECEGRGGDAKDGVARGRRRGNGRDCEALAGDAEEAVEECGDGDDEDADDDDDDDAGPMCLDGLFVNTTYKVLSMAVPCRRLGGDDGLDHDSDSDRDSEGEGEGEGERRGIAETDGDGRVAEIDDKEKHRDTGEKDVSECDAVIVSLRASTAATTDFDLTGQIVWPASVLLGHYLASRRGRRLLRNSNLVELGAGCGFAGCVAAHFCDTALLTDGSDTVVATLLDHNCRSFRRRFVTGHGNDVMDDASVGNDGTSGSQSNTAPAAAISAQKLLWGSRLDVRTALSRLLVLDDETGATTGRCDVVIAADVVQWPAVIEPFLLTAQALLWTASMSSSSNNSQSRPCPAPSVRSTRARRHSHRPTLVLSLVERSVGNTIEFFKWAKKLGFDCRLVHFREFLHGGMVPKTCREGGKKMEIWEIELRVDRLIDMEGEGYVPLLLRDRDDDDDHNEKHNEREDDGSGGGGGGGSGGGGGRRNDRLVGSEYEHTTSVPC